MNRMLHKNEAEREFFNFATVFLAYEKNPDMVHIRSVL